MYRKTAEELLGFIEKSPTSFQCIASIKETLRTHGFEERQENQRWKLCPGGNYFVTRNSSALIAFSIPEKGANKFHILAAHSDSPSFVIKENPEMEVDKTYIRLNVEPYGGMLMAPWFDRPLSVAGRLIVRGDEGLSEVLVKVDRDLLLIPNLAIHMNREANQGVAYKPQIDMLPLFGGKEAKGRFWEILAEEAKVSPDAIMGHDLYLYNRMKGCIWGANEEFLSAPRLDDLQCVFGGMKGFLGAEREKSLSVLCILDNEEVGSSTKQGAASTFLQDTLLRIRECLGLSYEAYLCMLADSFMLSADNAHGIHPNHADKADPVNRPYLNGGIVLKFSAAQKYCTEGMAGAILRDICARADVPVQVFRNRSDIPGGSTLGNISANRVAVRAADIGLAQLAMHSPYETCGVKDTEYLARAVREFFR
ncbi:MAG: M18 family aminopeptidase [Eubacteriales bacterium]|nr:M18 family aminopeptidase [Eubacteriales bacterium]